jgi:putative flippase GtrA
VLFVGKVLRYAGGSVVATVCSLLTMVVLYGPLEGSAGWSSCLAWLAGAVPNYWLNRSWTWRQRGRPNLLHEVLPYTTIVAVTLLLATLATRAADAGLRDVGTSSVTRVVLVTGTLLAVYVVMFVARFFLFDRLFTRLSEPVDHQLPATPTLDPSGSR